MYKKIFINWLFIILIFSGCSYKIDNTSKKESYKTLENISSLNVEKKDITIINGANCQVQTKNVPKCSVKMYHLVRDR